MSPRTPGRHESGPPSRARRAVAPGRQHRRPAPDRQAASAPPRARLHRRRSGRRNHASREQPGVPHDQVPAAAGRRRARLRSAHHGARHDVRPSVLCWRRSVSPACFIRAAKRWRLAPASAAGTGYILTTFSGTRLEEVRQQAAGPLWYQLYIPGGRAVAEATIARARAAGYSALVVTIDTPVSGMRERDYRNGVRPLLRATGAEAFPTSGSS